MAISMEGTTKITLLAGKISFGGDTEIEPAKVLVVKLGNDYAIVPISIYNNSDIEGVYSVEPVVPFKLTEGFEAWEDNDMLTFPKVVSVRARSTSDINVGIGRVQGKREAWLAIQKVSTEPLQYEFIVRLLVEGK